MEENKALWRIKPIPEENGDEYGIVSMGFRELERPLPLGLGSDGIHPHGNERTIPSRIKDEQRLPASNERLSIRWRPVAMTSP